MTDPHPVRTDIMSAEARSRLMARIGGRNTKPEVTLRKALFRLGFRYRLHPRDIPGRPDMVFPRWRAVVFVHGCFWHGHGCHLFKWPKGNAEFWQAKISGNVERDRRTLDALAAQGWRVLTVWECALRGRHRISTETLAARVGHWLIAPNSQALEVNGSVSAVLVEAEHVPLGRGSQPRRIAARRQ